MHEVAHRCAGSGDGRSGHRRVERGARGDGPQRKRLLLGRGSALNLEIVDMGELQS